MGKKRSCLRDRVFFKSSFLFYILVWNPNFIVSFWSYLHVHERTLLKSPHFWGESLILKVLMSWWQIVDGCIPLTVEACRALGLNTTKLPNLLNQTSIQETLTVLEIFKMQSCSDNAMLYLCTIMYPSCDDQSLPCSDFCRSKRLITKFLIKCF